MGVHLPFALSIHLPLALSVHPPFALSVHLPFALSLSKRPPRPAQDSRLSLSKPGTTCAGLRQAQPLTGAACEERFDRLSANGMVSANGELT